MFLRRPAKWSTNSMSLSFTNWPSCTFVWWKMWFTLHWWLIEAHIWDCHLRNQPPMCVFVIEPWWVECFFWQINRVKTCVYFSKKFWVLNSGFNKLTKKCFDLLFVFFMRHSSESLIKVTFDISHQNILQFSNSKTILVDNILY